MTTRGNWSFTKGAPFTSAAPAVTSSHQVDGQEKSAISELNQTGIDARHKSPLFANACIFGH